jgi:Arc/MetJ-type ribon-helix-helix transcriptional regulator
MKRTTVWLTKQQADKLKKLKKATGIGASEFIRRAVDELFTKKT